MAENDDRDVNAGPDAPGAENGQAASEGLHIAGQGHEALEDGAEHLGEPGDRRPSEDVFGNANVQSGRRSTNEGLLEGLPETGDTLDSQSPIATTPYTPSEQDNSVDSTFSSMPAPRTAGEQLNTDDEDEDEEADAEEEARLAAQQVDPQRTDSGSSPVIQGQTFPATEDEAPAQAPAAAPTETAAEPAPEGTPTTTPPPQDPLPGGDPEPEPAVAQTPTVSAVAASGVEDLALKLDIAAALNDTDGAESLSVVISGMPSGFSFSNAAGGAVGRSLGGGAWEIDASQLNNLYLVRPQHYSGDLTLTITVTATEPNGSTATSTTTMPVHVEAVADAPELSAVDTAGTENQWINLSVDAALVDADGSESLSVYITDLPPGATLNHGTQLTAPVTLPNATVLAAGTWVLSSADLQGLQVMPAADSSADFSLRVFAVTEESSNGDQAVSGPATIDVDVGVVAPTVSAEGHGAEDTWIAVDVTSAVVQADGNESLALFIENLPDNALLRYRGEAPLSPDADGRYALDPAKVDQLEVRWDETTDLHSDADISFQIRAVVTDEDVGTDRETARDTNETVSNVTVRVEAVADAPETPTVSDAAGTENEFIGLTISTALTDQDGSESLTVYITGVPDGALLNKGTAVTDLPAGVTAVAGTTTWAVAASDLAGLAVRPAVNDSRDFSLNVYAVSTESNPTETGPDQVRTLHAVSGPEVIDVDVGVLAPVVSGSGAGNEDSWADVSLTAQIQAPDPDAADAETLTVTVIGLPEDAQIRYDGGTPLTRNPDGSVTLDAAKLDAVQVRWNPASDHLHSDESITFTLRADVDDVDVGGATETARDSNFSETQVTVDVTAVADAVTLTAGGHGKEDSIGASDTPGEAPIAVDISLTLQDQDGSEKLLGQDGAQPGTVLLVSTDPDFAAGSFALNGDSSGSIVQLTQAQLEAIGDPSLLAATGPVYAYEIPASAFAVSGTNAGGDAISYTLPGLTFAPKTHSDNDVSFKVVATTVDRADGANSRAVTVADGTIVVDAVADAPTLETAPAFGKENAAIDLTIDPALVDTDGSESLTVYITGVPEGATLYHGADATPGNRLTALTADKTLEGGLTLPHGNTYAISIPAGVDAGTYLQGLKVVSAENDSSDFRLTVHAVSEEADNGDQAITSGTIDVNVGTLAPTVSLDQPVEMTEATVDGATNWTPISLNVGVQGEHMVDGSAGDTETLKVYVSGVPDYATLQAKINGTWQVPPTDADGRYVLTQADVANLRISTEAGADADFTLTVQAEVRDVDMDDPEWRTETGEAADIATTTMEIPVSVLGTADEADVEAHGVAVEDVWSHLTVSATAQDSSESVTSLKLLNVPDDAELKIVTGSGPSATTTVIPVVGGVAVLPVGFDGQLMIKAPQDFSGVMPIKVEVETTDTDVDGKLATGGETHTATYDMPVRVWSVADKPSLEVLDGADTPTGATDISRTIAEDDMYTITFGPGGDLIAETGEHGSGDFPKSNDGSESLTFRIEPVDAEHSKLVVTHGPAPQFQNGAWIVTAEQLSNGWVKIGGVGDWSSDALQFKVTAIATEDDLGVAGRPSDLAGTASSEVRTITLTVDAVTDGAKISSSKTMDEDTRAAVPINIRAVDADGSETLTGNVYLVVESDSPMLKGTLDLGGSNKTEGDALIAVRGTFDQATGTFTPDENGTQYAYEIPASAFKTPSFENGQSTYTVQNLYFRPEADNSYDIQYKVVATIQEAGDSTLPTVTNGSITVRAVADAPDVLIDGDASSAPGHVSGDEDAWVSLKLGAAVTDDDGTEYLSSAVLEGLPKGWSIGYMGADGQVTLITPSAAGTYTLSDIDRLGDVVVKAPLNWYGDSTSLKVSVTSTESGVDGSIRGGKGSATTTRDLVVDIDAVAQTPNVTVRAAVTSEEQAVALDISGQITDVDTQVGREASETLEFFVGNVQNGELVDGSGQAIGERGYFDADMRWHADASGTTVRLLPSEVKNVKFQPAEDFSGKVELEVRARAYDGEGSSFADRTAPLVVTVKGVVDDLTTPTEPVKVSEDQQANDGWFDAGLDGYQTKDMEGDSDGYGSERVSAVIHKPSWLSIRLDVEDGANPDDFMRYVGKDADGNELWSIDYAYMDAVQFKLPENFASNEPVEVPIDVVVTEVGPGGGASTTTHTAVQISVDAVADEPTVKIVSHIKEDAQGSDGIPVSISVSPTDTDAFGGAETITGLTVSFGGGQLPEGAELRFVINGQTTVVEVGGSDGATIVLTDEQVAALRGADGSLDFDAALFGVPEHSAKDIHFDVYAESTDINGSTAVKHQQGTVAIDAVADAPKTFDVADGPLSGAASSQVDLGLNVALADTDGSESAHLVITGGTDGVIIRAYDKATGKEVTVHNAGNGRWIVPEAHAGITLKAEGAGASATLAVTLVVTDLDPDTKATDVWQSEAQTVEVDFAGGSGSGGTPPSPPNVSLTLIGDGAKEDTAFSVQATVTPVDGEAKALVISGDSLPEGAELLTPHYTVPQADGTGVDYVITLPGGSGEKSVTLSIQPPPDYSGPIELEAAGVAQSGYITSEAGPSDDLVVDVAPVTETGTDAIGATLLPDQDLTEDSAGIAFTVTVDQLDADGSESIADQHLAVSGATLPAGTELSYGGSTWTWGGAQWTLNGSSAPGTGTVEIPLGDVSAFTGPDGKLVVEGLSVKPPADWHGNLDLSFGLTVQDQDAASEAWTGGLRIPVSAENDLRGVTASAETGTEDVATPITITLDTSDIRGVDTYGSEITSVVIRNVPAGMIIEGASNNGTAADGTTSWTVDASVIKAMGAGGVLSGVALKTPLDWAGSVDLKVEVYQMEASTKEVHSASHDFSVEVLGVADTPTVNPQDVTGAERTPVAMDLRAFVGDTDQANGAESLTVTIQGAPEGSYFTYRDGAGTLVTVTPVNGEAVLPVTGATDLSFVGPEYASGTYHMTVTPTATEGSSTAVGEPMDFSVTLKGVASGLTEAGLVVPSVVTGSEDQAGIALPISATMLDTDGSETLTFTVGTSDGQALPEGMVLVSGGSTFSISPVDGLFHVPADKVAGLQIRMPADWNGDLDLRVTATTTEADGDSLQTSADLRLSVAAVADAPDAAISEGHSVQSTSPVTVHALSQGGADSVLSFSDVDVAAGNEGRMTGLTVSLGGAMAGDALGLSGVHASLTDAGHVTITLGSDTFTAALSADGHTLTFSGDGSWDQYTQLANAVVLTNDDDVLDPGLRTVSFTASDDGGAGTPAVSNVMIGDLGAKLDHADGDVVWNGGHAEVLGVDPVAAGDAATLDGLFDGLPPDASDAVAGLSVTLSGEWQAGVTLGIAGQDVAFDPMERRLEVTLDDGSQVSVTYDSVQAGDNSYTHTLTFSGAGDAESYRDLADSVILTSNDGTLGAGTRQVSFTLMDGTGDTLGSAQNDVTVDTTLSLEDDARGNLFFTTSDTATIIGTGGDDIFVYGVAAPDSLTIQGGGGADTFAMMDPMGVEGDWVMSVDGDMPPPVDPTDTTGGLVYDVDVANGDATVHDDGKTVTIERQDDDTASSATVTFEDHKIELQDVEHLVT